LLVRVPLPMAEVQAQVEELTGQAGLQILRAILENEVTRRVGPPHRPNPTAGCVRWGKQSGYVVFGGQKISLERPRVRTREGQEVELESYGQLRQDGKLQRAVRERMVAGLSTRNWWAEFCFERSARSISPTTSLLCYQASATEWRAAFR
jgi:hypothetical protein